MSVLPGFLLIFIYFYSSVDAYIGSADIKAHLIQTYPSRTYADVHDGDFEDYRTMTVDTYGYIYLCTLKPGENNVQNEYRKPSGGKCRRHEDKTSLSGRDGYEDSYIMNMRILKDLDNGEMTVQAEWGGHGKIRLWYYTQKKDIYTEFSGYISAEKLKTGHLKVFGYQNYIIFSVDEGFNARKFDKDNNNKASIKGYVTDTVDIANLQANGGTKEELKECFNEGNTFACVSDYDTDKILRVPRYRPLYHRAGLTVYSFCCASSSGTGPESCPKLKDHGRCIQMIYDHDKKIDYIVPDSILTMDTQGKLQIHFPIIKQDKSDKFFTRTAGASKVNETTERKVGEYGNQTGSQVQTSKEEPTSVFVWVAIGVVLVVVLILFAVAVLFILRKSKNEKLRSIANTMTGGNRSKKTKAGGAVDNKKSIAKSPNNSATSTSATGTATGTGKSTRSGINFTKAKTTKGKSTKGGKSTKSTISKAGRTNGKSKKSSKSKIGKSQKSKVSQF